MVYRLVRSKQGELGSGHNNALEDSTVAGKVNVIEQELERNPKFSKLNAQLLSKLKSGDTIRLDEISILGHSYSSVVGVIIKMLKKNVVIYSARESLRLDPKSMKAKSFLDGLSLSEKIDQIIAQQRADRGLQKRRASGTPLGRPKGKRATTTKLTGKEEQIRHWRAKGIGYSGIARLLDVDRLTVRSFIEREKL